MTRISTQKQDKPFLSQIVLLDTVPWLSSLVGTVLACGICVAVDEAVLNNVHKNQVPVIDNLPDIAEST